MYRYFLSLGSNLWDKIKNIDIAMEKLAENGCKIVKIAPFFYTKPLMPNGADESYNKMFYNTAMEMFTHFSPRELLQRIKQIEYGIGRPMSYAKWSPRVIDIDILYCEKDGISISVNEEDLTIPHKEIFNRAFVLDPLAYIAPNLIINGKNVLDESKKHKDHQVVKMAIVNVNNNSFSGDGITKKIEIEKKIAELVADRVGFIDIGAESTNPNSNAITCQEEIQRLREGGVFDLIKKYKTNGVKFSIDTYHPETAKIAIENGFDVINDVNGFKDDKMWSILQNHNDKEAVIMHSIIPNGSKSVTIDKNEDMIAFMSNWVKGIKEKVIQHGIDTDRIIIDYGIGFGKTTEQDWLIINNFEKIDNCGLRTLIGFSRKSFMNKFGAKTITERDEFGKKLCKILQNKGVNIVRLH